MEINVINNLVMVFHLKRILADKEFLMARKACHQIAGADSCNSLICVYINNGRREFYPWVGIP